MKAAQHTAASPCDVSQHVLQTDRKQRVMREYASACLDTQTDPMGRAGLEQSRITSHDMGFCMVCGAKYGAFGTQDSKLQNVIDSWHGLPEAVRVGILAMVQASTPGQLESNPNI